MQFHNPTPFWRDDVSGTAAGDEIFTYWDNDRIRGFEGNDTLNGGQGNDTIFGGDDNDKIFGETSDDSLFGNDGNDTIDGGSSNDQIFGGDGNDRIIGGTGSDRMFGEDDNDTFIQNATFGADLIDGGSGVDTVDYGADRMVQANIALAEGNANATATFRVREFLSHFPFGPPEDLGLSDPWTETIRSIENVITGKENDTVTGNSSANRITTNDGSDILTGGGGEDLLNGGAGSDTFIFRDESDSTVAATGSFFQSDKIIGFGDGAGNQDVIDLSRVDAMQNANSIGNQNFRLDDGDGTNELGELHFRTIADVDQGGRVVTVAAADTDGNGSFDFGIRFDRIVNSLDAGDFIL
jgi:serralysin